MIEVVEDGARILIVDDDEDIRSLLRVELEKDLHRTDEAYDLRSVREAIAANPPDLIVLDLNLPDGDGLSFCRSLREDGFINPVIMVSARDTIMDRVLGLELGGDDYLVKPFEPRELRARVRNLLRRARASSVDRSSPPRYLSFGPWTLDHLQRRLIAPDGRLVLLSSAEFQLLDRLVAAPKQVLSREALLPERWSTVAADRSLDLRVSRLRRKLSLAAGPDELILTVRNEGYMLAVDVRPA